MSTLTLPTTTLSIVIITKNLEWNIARLIESILRETPAGTQIILSDSASTDGTVAIARSYGVTVLQLSGQQRLTAAAGRFVGQRHARGEFLLFLDGDHQLRPGWLPLGLAAMRRDPKLGVISGILTDVDPVPVKDSELVKQPPRATSLTVLDDGEALPAIKPVSHAGPAALYRRAALDAAGGWNPAVISDEEPELCLRIRAAGYTVRKLDAPIVFHHSRPYTSISNDFARAKKRLYLGYGQNLRNKLGTPYFWPYLLERGNDGFLFLIIAALGALALLTSLVLASLWPIAAWLGLQVLILAAYVVKKRSVYLAVAAYIHRFLCAEGLARGFFLDSPAMLREYKPQFNIIE
jgi:glycosyltransferase involved in cell wall biosynthesis